MEKTEFFVGAGVWVGCGGGQRGDGVGACVVRVAEGGFAGAIDRDGGRGGRRERHVIEWLYRVEGVDGEVWRNCMATTAAAEEEEGDKSEEHEESDDNGNDYSCDRGAGRSGWIDGTDGRC